MRVKTFTLNSKVEAIQKITREVLTLFKVEIVGKKDADYTQLSVIHHRLPDVDDAVSVVSKVMLFALDGSLKEYRYEDTGASDERAGAAQNRIIKLNLYHIFLRDFGFAPAPWGILHGVRPTKIIHRWIRMGLSKDAIFERLEREYACSHEKAAEIIPMAFRQLPFLRTSDEKTISIYVGIPFCLTRCLYCSFPANVLPKEKKLREFMEVFRKDLAAAKRDVERFGFKVQNIYVGGGTPTSLPDNFFAEMLDLIYNAFYTPNLVEFTVEAGRPDSMSEAKIAKMKERYVTRVSVNPQSMQQKTLDLIGRRHTPEDVKAMYHALRAAGIPYINMDVILGLPGETAADVKKTMDDIAKLCPDDITLHALALKRGSRLWKGLEERCIDLPSAEETRRMFETAMAVVKRLGMQPYYLYRQGYMAGDLENLGCCRKGAEGMYNIQIMEEHQTILGIGGAATTKVVSCSEHRLRSTFYPKDLTTYLREIDTYIKKRTHLLALVYEGNRQLRRDASEIPQ